MSTKRRREEPIFSLKIPLLFAHRGGALEVPESTEKGFNHALKEAKADVLEIDVQLTKCGKFVVWHGPELDNVKIKNESNRPIDRLENRRKIYHYKWDELDCVSWVADPHVKELPLKDINLSDVPEDDDRRLLLLSDFLKKYQNVPLNIEMKKSFKRKIDDIDRRGLKDNIKAFTDILDVNASNRTIIVASAYDDYIDEFRELNGEKYPTGLSIEEQLWFLFFGRDMKNRVLETSYDENLSSKEIIEKVRSAGGSTFVFLTGFGPFLPSIDDNPEEEAIFEILDRGVDGIMTDRPKKLREIIDKWIEQQD